VAAGGWLLAAGCLRLDEDRLLLALNNLRFYDLRFTIYWLLAAGFWLKIA
jgi:hypothetical protein